MTRRRALLAALALLLILAAAGLLLFLFLPGGSREPVAPRRWASAIVPEAPESTVVAPITVPMDVLESSMESSLPTVFVEEKDRELEGGFLLDAKITRTGKVTAAAKKGALELTLPVETRISVSPARGRRSLNVNCAMDVTSRSTLSLGKDWTLRSKTTLSYVWTRPPVLSVGNIDIPIEKLFAQRLDEQLAIAAARADENLEKRDPVRPRVEAAWASLFQPLPVRGNSGAWIVVSPLTLLSGEPEVRGDGVHIDAGLKGRMQLVLGDEPEALPMSTLPRRVTPEGEPAIALQVPLALSWDTLGELLTARIAGQPQQIEVPGVGRKVSLVVSRVGIYPSGARVVLALDYTMDGPSTPLDGAGRLYLSGVPVLDPQTRELSFSGLDAAVETDVDAVRAVGWLVKAGGMKTFEDQLHLPLQDRLDQAREQLEAGLKVSGDAPAALSGTVSALDLREIIPTEDALVLTLVARGSAELELTRLDRRGARPEPRGLELPGRRGGRKKGDADKADQADDKDGADRKEGR